MDLGTAPLIVSGLKLMFIGMGIVFFFLLLLVGVIEQTHRLMNRLEKPRSAPVTSAKSPGEASPVEDREVVAVIAAAVHQYEQQSFQ